MLEDDREKVFMFMYNLSGDLARQQGKEFHKDSYSCGYLNAAEFIHARTKALRVKGWDDTQILEHLLKCFYFEDLTIKTYKA